MENIEIRLIKKDDELIDYIIQKLDIFKKDRDKIQSMLRYNVLTVLQVSELTGLNESTITNKCRPSYINGELVVELDLCYPFSTLSRPGPKFIVRNEKLEALLRKDPGNRKRLTYREKLIRKIYSNQLSNCDKREMPSPDYTYEEFFVWIMKNPKYNELYKKWAESGYKPNLTPSCDRIDNDKSYTLSNLRIVAFVENKRMGNLASGSKNNM